jgi:peroxiredoxin
MTKTRITWLALAALLWLFGNASGAPAPAAAGGPAAGQAADVKHPDKAVCTVCAAKGGAHGLEEVAGMSFHEGAWYYFCAEDCKKEFDADPASFILPPLPRPAPDINVRVNGEDLPLAQFKGSVVLIDFWATWCKPCTKMIPSLQKLYDARKLDGLVVLGISIDEDAGRAVKYVTDKKITYPVSVDSPEQPVWQLFGVKAIPATFLVDADGQIVARWTGNEIKWDEVKKRTEALVLATKARSN